jgi:hypothetical protein
MPVILVNRESDPKRVIGKNGGPRKRRGTKKSTVLATKKVPLTLSVPQPLRVETFGAIFRGLVHRPRQPHLLPLEVDHLKLVQQHVHVLRPML